MKTLPVLEKRRGQVSQVMRAEERPRHRFMRGEGRKRGEGRRGEEEEEGRGEERRGGRRRSGEWRSVWR